MGKKFFKRTIRDVPLEYKTILVRADYNVPLNGNGEISDDLRIRASLPTLRYLIGQGCKIVIASHLGRPNGERNDAYSLRPVAKRLEELLETEVRLAEDCVGERARQAVVAAPHTTITLFENVRFHAGEEQNDENFAKQVADASGADYFVQDGFGVVHRAHATTDAITRFLLPVAGLLLEKEYVELQSAVESPKRPLVVILGGAKVSDKISIIEQFVRQADKLLIGGAMANTFLSYHGKPVGKSIYETEQNEAIDSIYGKAREKADDRPIESFVMIPSDVAVARSFEDGEERRVVPVDSVGDDDIALDIGDETIERFVDAIKGAGTVIWNGPVGYTELTNFAHGSARLALALATQPQTDSIIGGGDTADFILKWSGGDESGFTHISTGGGAGLELMAGEKLPGVEVLLDALR